MSIKREKENVPGTCQRRLGERECSPSCDSAERCDRRRMRDRRDDLHRTVALREGRAVLARAHYTGLIGLLVVSLPLERRRRLRQVSYKSD